MECQRGKGYYSSNIDLIPNLRGSYMYCITFLEKKQSGFNIYSQHGIIVSDNIRIFMNNMNKKYDGLIIEYVIKIDDWGKWDKKIILNYNHMLSRVGVKQQFVQITSSVNTPYNRNILIGELQHVNVFLRKIEEANLIYLNSDITNIYGL